MISAGDLTVALAAISVVVGFFLAIRHFIRKAQDGIGREDEAEPGAGAKPTAH